MYNLNNDVVRRGFLVGRTMMGDIAYPRKMWLPYKKLIKIYKRYSIKNI